MSIDYTIGDDIVAVVNHSQRKFKEGDKFICRGLKINACCGRYMVDIGIKDGSFPFDECHCGSIVKTTSDIWWMDSICFRKLDHTFAEEVTARIEEEINQENLVEA